MKFLRGVIHSAFLGTDEEAFAVKKLLTYGRKKTHIDDEGILYTGLVDFLKENLGARFPIEIEDIADMGPTLQIPDVAIPDDYITFEDPAHRIRHYQLRICQKALLRKRGIIEVCTGGGKTEMAAIISKFLLERGLAKKIYIITGTTFLMNQAATRFEVRGLKGVSRFGGGNEFTPSPIQVCVVDSLTSGLLRSEEIREDFADCDCIFFDEAHHAQAETWISVGEQCNARWRFGLTATIWSDPFKYSHEDFYLIGLTGGVIAQIPSSVLRKMGYLAEPLVTMIPIRGMRIVGNTWDDQYVGAVVRHVRRNSVLVSLAKSLYEGGRKTLLFVGRVDHALCLLKNIREQGVKHVYFVKGGEEIYEWMPSGRLEYRKSSVEELAALVRNLDRVVLIGTSVIDEGVDIPSFDSLVMGTALRKYRRTIQRAGRGMRPKPGENRVYIFDTVDTHNENLNEQSSYRIQTYQLEEFEFSESLENTAKVMNCELKLDLDCYTWEDIARRDATQFDPTEKFRKRRTLTPYGY